jgi:hypothetical protein
VPTYRAYFVGPDDHVRGVEVIDAPGDGEAVKKAKQLMNECDVEIWNAARFITKLTTDDNESVEAA